MIIFDMMLSIFLVRIYHKKPNKNWLSHHHIQQYELSWLKTIFCSNLLSELSSLFEISFFKFRLHQHLLWISKFYFIQKLFWRNSFLISPFLFYFFLVRKDKYKSCGCQTEPTYWKYSDHFRHMIANFKRKVTIRLYL